jgi:putative membrane protein
MLATSLAMAMAFAGTVQAQTNAAQADRAAPSPSAKSNAPDALFVQEASASGLAEVELGKLGASQGQSSAVKTFGQQMVDDHTKANEELKTIASGKSIEVSAMPPPDSAKAAANMTKLSGNEFDAAFKKRMVKDHEKAVKLFSKESSSGKDAELKAFATKTLPTLQHHLEMARQLP